MADKMKEKKEEKKVEESLRALKEAKSVMTRNVGENQR